MAANFLFASALLGMPLARHFDSMKSQAWHDWIFNIIFFGCIFSYAPMVGYVIDRKIKALDLAVVCTFCGKALDDKDSARLIRQTGQCKNCKNQIIKTS
ncbi:MAG: hypothetical protein JO316_10240 [Abitibacteriaceae bacterium]|nr:hypothetical protein [Abditibacteriaceae bacterium]